MNDLVKMILSMAGMPTTQIAEIDAAIPAMLRLLSDANKNDLNAVIPALKNILTFIEAKKKSVS